MEARSPGPVIWIRPSACLLLVEIVIQRRFVSLLNVLSATRLVSVLVAWCLVGSLVCTEVQAEPPWENQASRYLEKLLQSNPARLPELDEPVLLEFYQARKYKLLWSSREGRLDKAYDLLHVLLRAKDEGLEPSDYYLEHFNTYWDSNGLGETVQLDLLLSAALYRYSRDVHSGRQDPGELDNDWYIKRKPLDMRRLFTDVARKSSIAKLLKDLPPQHAGYQALKHQLHHFRELAQQGGWRRFDWARYSSAVFSMTRCCS